MKLIIAMMLALGLSLTSTSFAGQDPIGSQTLANEEVSEAIARMGPPDRVKIIKVGDDSAAVWTYFDSIGDADMHVILNDGYAKSAFVKGQRVLPKSETVH